MKSASALLSGQTPLAVRMRPVSLDEVAGQRHLLRAGSPIVALADLVSPTSAFVRDRCEVGPVSEVRCDELYAAWKAWAEDNGHRVGSSSSFGRDLRAVLPSLRTVRPRDDDRQRWYRGLHLSVDHNGPVPGPSWTRPQSGPAVQDGPGGQPLWSVGDEPPDVPAGATASDSFERDAATPDDALWRPLSSDPELAGAADLPAEPPGMFDKLPETVRCDDYRAHLSAHRRVGAGWVCDACDFGSAAREPDLRAPRNRGPHDPVELGDWLAVPLWEHHETPSDGWGTIE